MRLRLFWKLSLASLALLLLVLVAVDLSASRALRQDYLRAGFRRLDSLARLAESRPPPLDDEDGLRAWTEWMAKAGTRVTVILEDGLVLADSHHDPAEMENHADRPEIQQALSVGKGRAIRHSATLDRDLVYLAVSHRSRGGRFMVIRLAVALDQINEALSDIRRRLWLAFSIILALSGGASLLIARTFSRRIERLKNFSRRVAEGELSPLPVVRAGDELDELTRTLNSTAERLDQTIRKLTMEHNQSVAILSSMMEGVAVIGSNRRIRFGNQAFCNIFEIDQTLCRDKPMIEIIRQSDLLALVQQALGGGRTVSGEVTAGTVRPQSFLVTAAPVRADDAIGAVLVLHDISELRRLERVRRDFVANLSHELRTPLTAVQGFAETLLEGALEDPENNRRFVGIIRDHAIRLGRLTDDLLKLAQIESGKLDLEFRSVSIAALIRPVLETAQLRAGRKKISIEVRRTDETLKLKGDPNRLREVLLNLLDNALQYTPAGGRITLEANSAGGLVSISVSDTGIGIPESDLDRIFERFYRVDSARSRQAGGTGLGLAIARHLVEAHGGRIEVRSRVGHGSTFTVFLPITPHG